MLPYAHLIPRHRRTAVGQGKAAGEGWGLKNPPRDTWDD